MFDTVSQSTPITNLTDWTCAPGDIPGMVTNSRSFSPDYSVELPVPPGALGATKSSMILTGGEAYTWTSADNPTIRISARVFCSDTNQTISMRGGSASGEQWIVRFDGTDGHIKLNGVDTGASFITGRYADLALYYNVPSNTASLDYDGANIVSQASLGGTPTTQLNHVGFHRETSIIGTVFIDNLVIEVFPSSTIAWWRFEEGADDHVADHTGLFPVSECSLLTGYREWRSGDARMVDDGHGGFNNTHAFAGPELKRNFIGSHLMTPNWTVEGLIRIEPGALNVELFELGVGLGFDSSNSWISISWQQSWQSVAFSVRDNAQSTTQSDTSYNTNALLSADGQQHHFACVKTNNLLITYIDYIPRSTNVLSSVSLGVYEFNTNAYASVGEALNYGNSSSIKHVFDEIRYSNQALSPDTFLHAYGSIPVNDFDGDGKSDLGVYFPPLGKWYIFASSDGFYEDQFGYAGTKPITGDFDGDGKSDFGVYYAPLGKWYIFSSTDGFYEDQFGYAGTIPITGDFDGDGKCDFGCYHPPSGNWYLFQTTAGFYQTQFGFDGTIPVTGDFDGDGLCDYGYYHPPTGAWKLSKSTGGFKETSFGFANTVPITGDFDADGTDDFGVYYDQTGKWYIFRSTQGYFEDQFGYAGTVPVVGDFDGDGQSDIGCYYAPGGNWYIFGSATGFYSDQFGYSGTIPLGGTQTQP